MFCGNCGKELLEDARFCNNCGTPVPQPVPPGETTAESVAATPAGIQAETEAETMAGAEAWAEAEALAGTAPRETEAGAGTGAEAEASLTDTAIKPPLLTSKPGSTLVPPPDAHAEDPTRIARPPAATPPSRAAAAAAAPPEPPAGATTPRVGTALLEEEPPPDTMPGDADAHGPGGPSGTGGTGGHGSGRPGDGTNWTKWAAIALASLIVLALAIALPLLLTRGDDEPEPTTSTTTTTGAEQTTTTAAPTTTSSAPTTTEAGGGGPGDSDGEWVERTAPSIPAGAGEVRSVAVSDEYLLLVTMPDTGGPTLYAQSLASGETREISTEGTDIGAIDIDGSTAVWWEGTYDESASSFTDQHIYAYILPDGPRVEIVGNREVTYPQVADDRITWVEMSPWETNPDEYFRIAIYGTTLRAGGAPGEPEVLVPQALAFLEGDAGWHYSLGENRLAWEQATAEGDFQAGSYVLDLTDPGSAPISMGADSWRPSVSGNNVVVWADGLAIFDPSTELSREIDSAGDFPAAAPTFVAYLRSAENSGDFEIVARGVTGGHEQVLGRQSDPPWLSPALAAGERNVAFITDRLHVFEWRGG